MPTIIEDFAAKVREMRSAQKNYFKAARSGNIAEKKMYLEQSKQLEQEVDELTDAVLKKSLPEQQNLF